MIKYLIKYLLVVSILVPLFSLKANEFSDTKKTIDIRKIAMQGLWMRIKRISPYVELKENVEYNKELASNDADEILKLLDKTKNLWPDNSNLSGKGFTNATPAVWALPEYFSKLYSDAELSATELKQAIESDDIDKTALAMCNLGKACGTCHASFRRLLTSQLANEVNGWSGKYIQNCN